VVAVLFRKERAIVADATEQIRNSSELLLAVAGVAVVIAAIALVVAVSAKAGK
jgi:hypothetical protein